MGSSLEIRNVTAERAERLRAFLGRDGLQGFEGDVGTVRGDCIEVGYRYDPTTGLLMVEPVRLPAHLQDEEGAEPLTALRGMLETALDTDVDSLRKCAVWDTVTVNIVNRSGQSLTFSSTEGGHGSISIEKNRIEDGETVRAFGAESGKDSVWGVEGTVFYVLADSETTMNIHFSLTLEESTYNTGLEKGNASRFLTENEHTSPSTNGAFRHLEPTTTILQVKG